jgi:hypothetical protein
MDSTTINECHLCGRVKNWNGSDMKCPFQKTLLFSSDNWCCGILARLRFAIEKAIELDISSVKATHTDCQHQVLIDLMDSEIPVNEEGVFYMAMYVTWYKNRGRTESIWIICDGNAVKRPNRGEIEWVAKELEELINDEIFANE